MAEQTRAALDDWASRHRPGHRTTAEAAAALGLQVYDTAIPQDWANAVADATGIYPPGHVVWCYDGSLSGYPVALTEDGRRALGRWAAGRRIT